MPHRLNTPSGPGFLLPAALILLCLAAAGWLHLQAGNTLPLPVGDEVVFYYPALAFSESGSLQSDHLHADRALFWMPPGYMLLLAGWLKALGAGLATARWFSFALAALAYLLWSRLFSRWGLGLAGLALLSAAFLARHWVVMGNMVRMEPLMLCLWALGLLSRHRGSRWAALSWFLMSLAVHPNGVYFCAFWAIVQAVQWISASGQNRKASALIAGWPHLLPGLAAAALYAGYALLNWEHFAHDWQHQLSTRQAGGLSLLLFRPDQAAFILLWAGCAWALRRYPDQNGLWAPLYAAAVLWAMRLLGQGWSYGIFNILAVTLTAAVAVMLLRLKAFPQVRLLARAPKAGTAALAAGIFLVLVAAKVYSVPGVWATYSWQGMWPEAAYQTPYLTRADRAAVLARLQQAGSRSAAARGRPARVYFLPEGDGMLMGSAAPGAWVHVLPAFGSQLPDLLVWHRSGKGNFFADAEGDLKGIFDRRTDRPFYVRPGTVIAADEEWYLLDLRGRLPAFILPPKPARRPNNEAR